MASAKSSIRNFYKEPRTGGTGSAAELCQHLCVTFVLGCFPQLIVVVECSSAGGVVVRRSVLGGPHPLSVECKLWRSCALPGTFLASRGGDVSSEGQYYHLVLTAVLEPDPHVSHACCTSFCFHAESCMKLNNVFYAILENNWLLRSQVKLHSTWISSECSSIPAKYLE